MSHRRPSALPPRLVVPVTPARACVGLSISIPPSPPSALAGHRLSSPITLLSHSLNDQRFSPSELSTFNVKCTQAVSSTAARPGSLKHQRKTLLRQAHLIQATLGCAPPPSPSRPTSSHVAVIRGCKCWCPRRYALLESRLDAHFCFHRTPSAYRGPRSPAPPPPATLAPSSSSAAAPTTRPQPHRYPHALIALSASRWHSILPPLDPGFDFRDRLTSAVCARVARR
ncbi:hypothetical protein C8F01DRAFT_1107385 [Mycena amicta]|nr:hypothetical protein C8F01DRAFT_1170853 [Mycena amicta]KAJ7070699.1 hypothetical protein C8F01DRAFT_1107385 [Mycena amicta]